jgi:hypothetical protein
MPLERIHGPSLLAMLVAIKAYLKDMDDFGAANKVDGLYGEILEGNELADALAMQAIFYCASAGADMRRDGAPIAERAG